MRRAAAAWFAALLSTLTTGALAVGESEAYKVASIDSGQLVAKNGIEVRRAEAAIAGAASVCGDASSDVLAARAITTAKMLMSDGVFARPLDILEGTKAVFAGKKGKQDCTSFFAQYADVRKSVGYTHSEAVAALRVIANAALPARR